MEIAIKRYFKLNLVSYNVNYYFTTGYNI